MRKLGAILFACFAGLLLAGCTNTPDLSLEGGSGSAVLIPRGSEQGLEQEPVQNDPNVWVYRDCTVTILGYSLQMDHEGCPAVRVEYQFKNNSQSPASFSTTVIPNARQDTETLLYTAPAQDDPQYSAMLTLMEPGESIICAGYFKLADSSQPVVLEIKDLRDSSAQTLCRTLEIGNMAAEDIKK